MPYVLRYKPEPPSMPPQYIYDDSEYYEDLAKPRSRRRKRNNDTHHHPNNNWYDPRIANNNNNSLIKSYPTYDEHRRSQRRVAFDYDDYYDDDRDRNFDSRSEPPVVLVPLKKRAKRRQRPHTQDYIEVKVEPEFRRKRIFDHHIHTHRSSKAIPSMNYDRVSS